MFLLEREVVQENWQICMHGLLSSGLPSDNHDSGDDAA